MIDLASIRNASFTLTPTGYNPEEVDRFLADLADQLEAQPVSIEPRPVSVEAAPQAPPALPPIEAARPEADLDGLSGAIDRTIGALDAFVQNELAAVRAASDLEVEEIHRERERLLDEAADAARAHLDEAKSRADEVGRQLRTQAEEEAARIVAAAEDRKSQADEMVAAAARVQAQVLGQLESARATLGIPTEVAASAEVHPIESPSSSHNEQTADPEADEVRDATDAAA
jgi:DivIVA domain-containing protein